MDSSEIRGGEDYHSLFDPSAYLSGYFSYAIENHPFLKFYLTSLHKIYSEGKVKGKRIIDIGCGPTIHSLIPAANWFDELYSADFSAKNIGEVQKWLARDPEAHDWQDHFKFFAEKDGNRDAWQQYEENLRVRIKRTLLCDYHLSNPLHPENMGQFNAVTMSNALISGNRDLDQYRAALKNVVSLLKPGGFLIDVTVLGCPFYVVGKEKFSSVFVSSDDVMNALKDVGVDVIEYFQDQYSFESDITECVGAVFVLGRKK